MKEINMSKIKKNPIKLLVACVALLVILLIIESLLIIKMEKTNDTNYVMGSEKVINAIETPVVDLIYGFESVDRLKVAYNDEEPYVVTFLADIDKKKNIEILKFYFDDESGAGSGIGTIKDKNGKIVKMSVEKVAFDDSLELHSDHIARLSAIQEELLDTIVSNLEIVEYISEEEKMKEKYVMTDTPYLQIPFPKEWEEYLVVEQIEEDPYKVVFSCQLEGNDPVVLFTCSFGEDAEDIIGYLNDIPVGLSTGTEEAKENWNLADKDIFYTMRDEMYSIMGYMSSIDGFSLAE